MDTEALGRFLRETREAQERTLDDAVQALHIRARILEAFERGDFELADVSPVQIRGFVRNYALFLGLDADTIGRYYEVAVHGGGPDIALPAADIPDPVAPRTITDTHPKLPTVPASVPTLRGQRGRSPLLTFLLILAGGVGLVVIGFVAAQFVSDSNDAFPAPDDGQPDILQQLPATLTFTPGPTPTPLGRPTAIPPPGQQAFSGQGVNVNIRFDQRTWVQITIDGRDELIGIIEPGETVEYSANTEIILRASNAAALDVIYNGQPQGAFGMRGQRVDVTFRQDGVDISSGPGFEPTPEFTSTPEPTSTLNVDAIIAALTPSATPLEPGTPGAAPTPLPVPGAAPTDPPAPDAANPTVPTVAIPPTTAPLPTATTTALPSPTSSPTITQTPTETLSPTPTAILPPRVTQAGLPPTKSGA